MVDEIDLHLHPRWQREIRQHLTTLFPRIQFISTAHSPLMAQSSLDENLAVVRIPGDHALIDNDPVVIGSWRLDQVLTSDLFGFSSARRPQDEKDSLRRQELLSKEQLSAAEQSELDALRRNAEELPTAELAEDRTAMEIIRQAAARLAEEEQAK